VYKLKSMSIQHVKIEKVIYRGTDIAR
ncbi:MAG: hypothetical protein PWP38_1122, partial [Clostridiales bacterium]|nr:hypothetical protein [Clostridiales bacterium]